MRFIAFSGMMYYPSPADDVVGVYDKFQDACDAGRRVMNAGGACCYFQVYDIKQKGKVMDRHTNEYGVEEDWGKYDTSGTDN